MSRNEIIEKLDTFLAQHMSPIEECHVVYLMVEIRKILDHENNNNYPLLKFYCDWTVHTEKDVITKEIKEIMKEIYQTAKNEIEKPVSAQAESEIVQFFYMERLRREIEKFLRERSMNVNLVEEGNWTNFIQLLVKILENQPIKKPIDDILQFSFIPAASGCVRGVIEFKQPINGKTHYQFANAY